MQPKNQIKNIGNVVNNSASIRPLGSDVLACGGCLMSCGCGYNFNLILILIEYHLSSALRIKFNSDNISSPNNNWLASAVQCSSAAITQWNGCLIASDER